MSTLPPVGTRVTVALYKRVEPGVIVEHAPSCAGPMLAWVLLDNGQAATAAPRVLTVLK